VATGPLETDLVTSLQTERDALARRCAAVEADVQRLKDELAQVRAQVAELQAVRPAPISLFEEEHVGNHRLTGDGSDPRVLSGVLAATAVVAAMVAFLAMLNGNLFTPFGIAMVLITIGLAWGAARTRVVPVDVSVVRGIVYVEQGESSYRFDLRKPETKVEMLGRPGDPGWSVTFPRRHLEPFVVDASMVDPHEFVAKLREYRPEL
jgi:hypothetical protein